MVDFRYHLISLIAVFLALGLGILMGSVVLSDVTVNALERRVTDLDDQLDARHTEVAELRDSLNALDRFSVAVEPVVLGDVMRAKQVVLMTFEGGDAFLGPLRTSVAQAGGEVVAELTFTERWALSDEEASAELATITMSSETAPGRVRTDAARTLGRRIAQAAARDELHGGPVALRLEVLLEDLEAAGFLAIEAESLAQAVPRGASFLVAAGSTDEPAFGVGDTVAALAGGLGDGGAPVVVAQPARSAWNLVEAVRGDAIASARVSTVEDADLVYGRIAAVLALDEAARGELGHYGPRTGEVIPERTPEP